MGLVQKFVNSIDRLIEEDKARTEQSNNDRLENIRKENAMYDAINNMLYSCSADNYVQSIGRSLAEYRISQ